MTLRDQLRIHCGTAAGPPWGNCGEVTWILVGTENTTIDESSGDLYGTVMFVNYDNRLRSRLRFSLIYINQMSRVTRNPVFGVSDQIRQKTDCTFIGDG